MPLSLTLPSELLYPKYQTPSQRIDHDDAVTGGWASKFGGLNKREATKVGGMVQSARPSYEELITTLHELMTIAPAHIPAQIMLARLYHDQDHHAIASTLIQRIVIGNCPARGSSVWGGLSLWASEGWWLLARCMEHMDIKELKKGEGEGQQVNLDTNLSENGHLHTNENGHLAPNSSPNHRRLHPQQSWLSAGLARAATDELDHNSPNCSKRERINDMLQMALLAEKASSVRGYECITLFGLRDY